MQAFPCWTWAGDLQIGSNPGTREWYGLVPLLGLTDPREGRDAWPELTVATVPADGGWQHPEHGCTRYADKAVDLKKLIWIVFQWLECALLERPNEKMRKMPIYIWGFFNWINAVSSLWILFTCKKEVFALVCVSNQICKHCWVLRIFSSRW